MASPGPAPKPTALKLLHGTPGQRKLPTDEPKPDTAMPVRPVWLNGEAKAEWDRVVPELHRLGLATSVDRAALIAYCDQWRTYVTATRAVLAQGAVISLGKEDDDGEVTFMRMAKNPNVLIARDALMACKSFMAEFGLTPSARGRMSVPGKPESDDGSGILS